MSAVPLEVTEEAAAHIAKLGMQPELEQMLDWVRRNVTGLQEMRVAMRRRLGTRDPALRGHLGFPGQARRGHALRSDRVGVGWLESPDVSAPGLHLVHPVLRLQPLASIPI